MQHARRSLTALTIAGLIAVPGVAVAASAPTTSPTGQVTIRSLSNRADLLSGGDAAIGIGLPRDVRLRSRDVRVLLNGRDVKRSFGPTPRGIEGVVDDLPVGVSTLQVRLSHGRGAQIDLTNHPIGGPIFAGPQVQPWVCTTQDEGLGVPEDAQCNAPTTYTWEYQPTGAAPGSYQPYDPTSPPSDVAVTTTDQGHRVPFIIRVEEGTVDRSIYRIGVLDDPSKPWTRLSPQNGWNGKVFVPFGGGCGTSHKQHTPLNTEEQSVVKYAFLSRGWMGIANGMGSFAQNCNDVVAAEALMMQKEHVEERYGPIRHTIGMGGSGGSELQYHIAAAYPGLLNGITPNSAFPDMWHTATDVIDCHLLNNYFQKTSPYLWPSVDQRVAVEGKQSLQTCALWEALFSDGLDPANRGATGAVPGVAPFRQGCELQPGQAYYPTVNPKGVRCSIQDYQAAIWGRRGPENAAPMPLDNTGVQYGLRELQAGVITPAQFVDLNSNIGGLTQDGDPSPKRLAMDRVTADTMYRAARHADPRQLANVAIVDVRNNSNDDIHQPYMSQVVRSRFDKVNGSHANHVLWDHRGESEETFDAAVVAVDKWLTAVEADHSARTRAQKILADRPTNVRDTCWISGVATTNAKACRAAYPVKSDARIQAGGPLSSDVRKCQLVPLRRRAYRVTFTDPDWTTLKAAFPSGVCDWSRPSVGYQKAIPWITYTGGPGGEPLGAAPTYDPTGFSK
jgi:hypothetical protein